MATKTRARPAHPRAVRDPATIGKITRTPNIQGGAPCIAGTRVTTSTIGNFHAGGHAVAAINKEFPHLTEADIIAAIAYERVRREKAEAAKAGTHPDAVARRFLVRYGRELDHPDGPDAGSGVGTVDAADIARLILNERRRAVRACMRVVREQAEQRTEARRAREAEREERAERALDAAWDCIKAIRDLNRRHHAR